MARAGRVGDRCDHGVTRQRRLNRGTDRPRAGVLAPRSEDSCSVRSSNLGMAARDRSSCRHSSSSGWLHVRPSMAYTPTSTNPAPRTSSSSSARWTYAVVKKSGISASFRWRPVERWPSTSSSPRREGPTLGPGSTTSRMNHPRKRLWSRHCPPFNGEIGEGDGGSVSSTRRQRHARTCRLLRLRETGVDASFVGWH